MSSIDPPLSISDLTDLLIKHGIRCKDDDERNLIAFRVATIGYYRLEEYTWPFRELDAIDNTRRTPYFKRETPFEFVWSLYVFDWKLRLLLMDAIEHFEIALRCFIVQVLITESQNNTPHMDLSLMPGMMKYNKRAGKTQHEEWLENLRRLYNSPGVHDPRLEQCKSVHNISQVEQLPIWILMELASFGSIKKLYESMRPDIQDKVATLMGVPTPFLTSTITLFNQVRNRCAHHKRVWNFRWVKPAAAGTPLFSHVPTAKEWFLAYDSTSNSWKTSASPKPRMSLEASTTAFVILLCGFWVKKISPTSAWHAQMEYHIQPKGEFRAFSGETGLSTGWNSHPLWR